jgi:transaldolase/transaldolase/glucose-6-phosphate isomerase
LWASTSSKDPAFSDVKYVESLIGRETINTIPMETLIAFRDHGNAADRLEENPGEATQILVRLQERGIKMEEISEKLEDEGVEKFIKPYDLLLNEIAKQKHLRNVG